MTTWTMDQVRRVARLSVRVEDLGLRSLRGTPDLVAYRMARRLILDARGLGFEIHEADLAVARVDLVDGERARHVEMRWSPTTSEVELHGGSADGQRVTVPRVGDSLRIPVTRPAASWLAPEEAPTVTEISHATYELAGWRANERIWVYAAR